MGALHQHDRRIWRTAFILSAGDRSNATRLLRQIVKRRPDHRSLDRAHLDRLVVLAAREVGHSASAPGSGGLLGASDETFLREAAALPRQSFEAWVFTELDELELKDASRAMDCSTAATERHRRVALASLSEDALYEQRLASLRRALDQIDPLEIIMRAHGRDRLERRRRFWTATFAVVVVVLVVARELVRRGLVL